MRVPSPAELGRLWRTVRWLRAEQLLGRARLHLAPRPALETTAAPPRRPAAGAWARPAAREPSLEGPGQQRFLGVSRALDTVGWDDPSVPLLWRYNQHYFDDLCARGADERTAWHRALVQRWIDENRPGLGTAWAPYPTSLRIVNWIKWFWGGAHAPQAWLDSLAVQTRWLSRRLEWHLLGNHLFANAKALLMAGLFFDGSEAAQWRHTAMAILQRELPEQFLEDGAQFERSPMYHALGLEDLLDLLNALSHAGCPSAAEQQLQDDLARRASRALDWMRALAGADGGLARFNDSADGIAPRATELERLAAALGVAAPVATPGPRLMLPSGYARLARGRALVLADVAPIGPDYLPGHAHADTLSFELFLDGLPLLVNRGTSEYGTGPRRQLERGTAAHSTVQLGQENSSEVWAGFRVGRRARVSQVHLDGWTLRGAHDGYAHCAGSPLHRRCWTLHESGLDVDDHLAGAHGPAQGPAVARFHLAPGHSLKRLASSHWQVVRDDRPCAAVELEAGTAEEEAWQHAEGFGRLVPAVTLRVALDAQGRCRARWHWID